MRNYFLAGDRASRSPSPTTHGMDGVVKRPCQGSHRSWKSGKSDQLFQSGKNRGFSALIREISGNFELASPVGTLPSLGENYFYEELFSPR